MITNLNEEKTMEAKFDSTNNEQRSAYRMIERTNNSFFLAGRAGTGKTTFLKNVQEGIKKNFVILAPTGQAAINAGGQTIHSFFGFNFGVLGPGEIGSMNRMKIGLVRNLDTIIIDEVSMVRCDIIDAIDRTLRHYVGNSAPFGGIQMVFVGDMFQLEPIATQKDRETLKDIYGHECFYFYKAAAIERINLPKIEFLKIYRQSDPGFIELLEHVRLGKMTVRDLIRINSRVSLCEDERMRITLCSTNADAKRINDGRLAEIDSEEKIYNATYSGKTRVTSDVAEELLTLKVGAQVMFTKNDRSRRWVNGTIGEIIELGEENVTVKLESGEQYIVEKEDWESIDYEYDHEKKRCIKTITGKVEQLPLRLAWAITIHKSQSLTFDHVAIDFGRGAFSNGQAYVALSRARTFDGLELVRPMSPASVRVSRAVLDFAEDFNDNDVIDRELSIGEAISAFEKSKDYDGAAVTLYEMASEEVGAGHTDRAYDYLMRAMAFIVDDECLKGKSWTTVNGAGNDFSVMNACGLYYSGKTDAAEAILRGLDNIWLDNNLLGLYLLARCLEDKEQWAELEEVYYRMLAIFNSVRDMGLDSISFRKMKYRLAILNERQFGDPGLGVMRNLIAENPSYERYHLAFRWMLWLHPEPIESYRKEMKSGNGENDIKECKLIEMTLDQECSDGDFLQQLRADLAEKTDGWNDYRHFINGLKLPMAF